MQEPDCINDHFDTSNMGTLLNADFDKEISRPVRYNHMNVSRDHITCHVIANFWLVEVY